MSGQWLEIVAKEHKYYVDVVKSFGEYNFAEDIVQEMYLRIHKYTSPEKIVKDGIVNKGFIWFVLRNIYVDYCKQRNKITKVDLNEAVIMSDEQNTEALNELYDKIEREIESWHWYDTMLFKLYRDSGKSMRELEAETKISLTSIFHTIKHCKARINAAISEDYYDVLNN